MLARWVPARPWAATATLGLIARAADAQPLLLLVDDAQWLDAASAEALLFSLRRLRAERIAALLATRDGTAGATATGLPELVVPGLSLRAAAELLDRSGGRPLGMAALAALVAETGGNPLALLELPRSPGRAAGAAAPPRLGERLERAFGARLDQLPASTREAILLLAAGGTDVDVLGLALAGRGLAPADLETAEAAGLLTARPDGVAFAHPLVRSASYHRASPEQQRAAHATLAEVLSDRTGPHEAERAVRHRAAATAGPDERVAAALERAAEVAARRLSYGAAQDLYEQAMALAPNRADGARRGLQAALMTLPAGRVDDTARLVEAVSARTDDWRLRTEALHVRARVEMWGGQPIAARDLLLRLADDVEPRDPLWAGVMLSHAALLSASLGEQRRAASSVGRAAQLCRELSDEWLVPILLLQALVAAVSADSTAARGYLTRCAPHLPTLDPLGSDQLLLVAGLCWLMLEEPDQARR